MNNLNTSNQQRFWFSKKGFVVSIVCILTPAIISFFLHKNTEKSGNLTQLSQTPQFPGGEKALHEYIKSNFEFPDNIPGEGVDWSITDTIYVKFDVNESGNVCNTRIIKGSTPQLDKEALRVISAMPSWSPGILNKKPVRVEFTIPINLESQRYSE